MESGPDLVEELRCFREVILFLPKGVGILFRQWGWMFSNDVIQCSRNIAKFLEEAAQCLAWEMNIPTHVALRQTGNDRAACPALVAAG